MRERPKCLTVHLPILLQCWYWKPADAHSGSNSKPEGVRRWKNNENEDRTEQVSSCFAGIPSVPSNILSAWANIPSPHFFIPSCWREGQEMLSLLAGMSYWDRVSHIWLPSLTHVPLWLLILLLGRHFHSVSYWLDHCVLRLLLYMRTSLFLLLLTLLHTTLEGLAVVELHCDLGKA